VEHEKRLVQQQFGKTAASYVASRTHGDEASLSQLIQMLHPQATWIGLDIATGGGHLAGALAPHVTWMFATDITPDMLAAARGHLTKNGCTNVGYVVADAEQLPFLEDSFDVVTCRIAAHHFPNPKAFVAEVRRVLKPGGRFLLVDNVAPEDDDCAQFLNTFEKMRDISHVRCLKVSEWTGVFQEQGLTVVRQEQKRKTLEFEPWMERMAESEEHRQAVEQYLLQATEKQKQTFSIDVSEGRVSQFAMDEWAVVCEG
jgi:ubiquinone/menaquinone biosynthesis C-methylase UbiE